MPDYNIQLLFNKCLENDRQISPSLCESINLVVDLGERQKAVLTVVVTGLVYKYYHPEQDVRNHQSNMEEGYSGRTFDTKYITPFMRKNNFPSMAESGWLTRSLEQNVPYSMGYTGSISGNGVKKAFLAIYQATETESVFDILTVLFKGLIDKRDKTHIILATPANLTVQETLNLIEQHFFYSYTNVTGASRLPSLAIFSAYKVLTGAQHGRYQGKILCDLDSHTAADKSTGSIGDIQINLATGEPYEGLEIKAKKFDLNMIDIAYNKIQEYGTIERYYILSTDEKVPNKICEEIKEKTLKIRSKHGCELIVNGAFTTLKYFLRLIDSKVYLEIYVNEVSSDQALKYEHKEAWNELCSDL